MYANEEVDVTDISNVIDEKIPTYDTNNNYDSLDVTNVETDEQQDNEDKKKKQLEILKQTYVDVAKRKINRQKNIYNPVIDTEIIVLSVNILDKNFKEKIKKTLKSRIEKKCNKHGLIKKNSVTVINTSSPLIYGSKAEFQVTYQAMACNPVEGMVIECIVIATTKAGIRAELINNDDSPIVIFISRDHNNSSNYFNNIKEQQAITVKIIGVRYELNDSFVSVIGELYKL